MGWTGFSTPCPLLWARCPYLGNGRSLSLPRTRCVLFFLEPSPLSSFLGAQDKLFSCLPQSPVFGVLSSSLVSRAQALMSSLLLGAWFSLILLWPRAQCTLSPLPWGFLAGFSSPVPLFGSSCPLHAKLVPGVVNFYGHCGEYPRAGCTLFILFVAIKTVYLLTFAY